MSQIKKYADVYIGYPVKDSFTYSIPEGIIILPGMRVRVDFKGKIVNAFVDKTHSNEPAFDESKIKPILKAIDTYPIFNNKLIELCRFASSNYICDMGEIMSMALPSGENPSGRYKHPFKNRECNQRKVELNKEQAGICGSIITSYNELKLFHLIFGITGSGKTEVYIELAREMIKRGKSAIYLVPEITLTSQTFERLYNVFGEDLIVYHSHLTANQRLHSWIRFFRGEVKIAIGTRSAVFLQCPDLGLIIMDEEHDGSYKEHSTPRYHARRIAYERCKNEKALMVIGSATPSIESLYAAEKGIFLLHNLKGRYGTASLPEIDIVKINPGKGEKMLSPKLMIRSREAIEAGHQAIYLLNRRGFSPIVHCNKCGHVLECLNCNISLNFHKGNKMICHYCGYSRSYPEKCPQCQSEELMKIGAGTQRIEEEIKSTFINSKIFRLDQDSSRKKDALFDLVKKMVDGDIDILIGTQMVAKGFDFHNVSVVGVLLADIGLNLPDFRSSEKIFALLMQVAGRCGRGEIQGRVVIQTLNEDHYLYKYLKDHDYFGFYKHELSVRRMLDYPPFSRIARLLIRGKNEDRVVGSINKLKSEIDEILRKEQSSVKILGPASAPFGKIANNYRHHLILKSKNLDELRKLISAIKGSVKNKGIYMEIDIDPYDIL